MLNIFLTVFDGIYIDYPRCYLKQQSIFQLCWFNWERQEPHKYNSMIFSIQKKLNIHLSQLACPCCAESKSYQSLRRILPLQSILAEIQADHELKNGWKKSKCLVLHSAVIYLYFLDFEFPFLHVTEAWKACGYYHLSCFHSKNRY